MKDSTKEYLKAGGLFAWGVAKSLVAGTAHTYGTVQTGRSMDKHWNKAEGLREEEKAAAAVPVGAKFVLPPKLFQDGNGETIPGGKWKVKSVYGRRILLEQSGTTHWFLWNDIKEYRRQ